LGAIGGYGQSAADSAMQQFRNLAGVQQAQQQSQQEYNQAMLDSAQQNAASKNSATASLIGAVGKLAGSGMSVAGQKFVRLPERTS